VLVCLKPLEPKRLLSNGRTGASRRPNVVKAERGDAYNSTQQYSDFALTMQVIFGKDTASLVRPQELTQRPAAGVGKRGGGPRSPGSSFESGTVGQ